MGSVNFLDFYRAANSTCSYSVVGPLNRLFTALTVNVDLSPVMINAQGSVTFTPTIGGAANPKPRTTSLTRMVRYISQEVPSLLEYDWQPLQDEIVRWAAMELDSDFWAFELVTGDALVEAYRDGPHSCMAGRTQQLQLYAMNPERVALLKVYEMGIYRGRALVWTADDGRKFMDRVYPGNGTLSFAARRYAAQQGWAHKDFDGVGSAALLGDFYVTLRHPNNRRIPYLDTLRYVSNCVDSHITLTHTATAENEWFQAVGNYTGFENRVYQRLRYIDGSPVVNEYYLLHGVRRFRPSQPVSLSVYVKGSRPVMVALRPSDELFLLPTEPAYRLPSHVVKVGDHYYLRSQVRKRRGRDEFVPKNDAVRYQEKGRVHAQNGATLITLEVAG